jgi:hypothetical protein
MGRSALSILALTTLVAVLQGCGGGSESRSGSEAGDPHRRKPAPAAIRVPPLRSRAIGVEHLRRAVLQGIGRDYLSGTQVGPPSFGLCLQRGLWRRLDERTLRALALVYRRPSGQQFTAQALADLAVPIGDRCGGRRFVPVPIEASMAFRAGRLPATGAFASERYSFEGRLPSGWQRSDARLVPLLMPREVLSVGTFPMPVGGGGNCGREPVVAIRHMRPGDALVSIQEYEVTVAMHSRTGTAGGPPSRRESVRGLSLRRQSRLPGEQSLDRAPLWSSTLWFRDHGRWFDALVYLRGEEPSPTRLRQIRAILDALRLG